VKIYTRTGDAGETGLFGGGRVGKDAQRVAAYGAVDELNAVIGLAASAGLEGDLDPLAEQLQTQLFELGADLATPPDSAARAEEIVRVGPDAVAALEAAIDRCEGELAPLESFILPGGSPAGAALHLARTVCRRAERDTVALGRTEPISETVVPYLNRLSDLLFVMARLANARAGQPERKWLPKK
jgi:cob(I)alamin adenosyltransferase